MSADYGYGQQPWKRCNYPDKFHQKYTMHLLPQADKIVITLYDWEYDSESESIAAGGHANAGYQIVQGSFAELSSQQKFCGLIEAILSSRLI